MKIHYKKGSKVRAACGMLNPRCVSTDFEEVNCKRCLNKQEELEKEHEEIRNKFIGGNQE